MFKPILIPIRSSSEKFEQNYVLVHPWGNGEWAYSCFNGNGRWQSASIFKTKEEAQKEARKRRKRLRERAKGLH